MLFCRKGAVDQQADERRRADVAAAAGRERVVDLGTRERMTDSDRSD